MAWPARWPAWSKGCTAAATRCCWCGRSRASLRSSFARALSRCWCAACLFRFIRSCAWAWRPRARCSGCGACTGPTSCMWPPKGRWAGRPWPQRKPWVCQGARIFGPTFTPTPSTTAWPGCTGPWLLTCADFTTAPPAPWCPLSVCARSLQPAALSAWRWWRAAWTPSCLSHLRAALSCAPVGVCSPQTW